jgi:hypothetical protein
MQQLSFCFPKHLPTRSRSVDILPNRRSTTRQQGKIEANCCNDHKKATHPCLRRRGRQPPLFLQRGAAAPGRRRRAAAGRGAARVLQPHAAEDWDHQHARAAAGRHGLLLVLVLLVLVAGACGSASDSHGSTDSRDRRIATGGEVRPKGAARTGEGWRLARVSTNQYQSSP